MNLLTRYAQQYNNASTAANVEIVNQPISYCTVLTVRTHNHSNTRPKNWTLLDCSSRYLQPYNVRRFYLFTVFTLSDEAYHSLLGGSGALTSLLVLMIDYYDVSK